MQFLHKPMYLEAPVLILDYASVTVDAAVAGPGPERAGVHAAGSNSEAAVIFFKVSFPM